MTAAKVYFNLLLLLIVSPASAECLTDYSRSHYPHWQRLSGTYQDVRQEVVAGSVVSDLKVSNGRVVGGLWFDPFTGQNYDIEKVTPDIDHLVSLKWAHSRGAKCFDYETRKALANDPDNLWAVHPSSNRQKGSDVSGWLPANLGICTQYLKQVKKVIEKYDLTPNKNDVKRYNMAVKKCTELRKGIRIKKAKSWFNFWRN